MAVKSLKEAISDAEARNVAIGHFNISNIESFWAIVNSAKRLDVPVIIGLSEGERKFFGMRQAVVLVKHLREQEGMPIYINADHTYSIEGVKEAIDAGVDSVIFDGAKVSKEENVAYTKEAVEYARTKDHEVLVEGELGYIGLSSKLLDEIPEGVSLENLTTADEAKEFIAETGAQLLAPAVGNIHGMLKGVQHAALNTQRITEIRKAANVPLVLHGGSGTSDEDFRAAIAAGISIVHINTEIRVAYRQALEKTLSENPDEVAPYRIMSPSVEAMEEVITRRLKLFNNID